MTIKKFETENLSSIPEQKDNLTAESNITHSKRVRLCVDVNQEVSEKIKDHAYWSREGQQEILLRIIERFVKENPIESRPESRKYKLPRGPKKKKNLHGPML